MPSVAEACAVLGVSEAATPDQVRAAYRQRMRALHPDNGGDDSVQGRSEISEVVEAWRVLSGHDSPTSSTSTSWTPNAGTDDGLEYDDEVASRDWYEVDPEDRMSPRLLRVFFVAATVLVLGWLMIFFLIAWFQSG